MENTMNFYKVSEKDLKELLKSYHELQALEYGGVDNWSFYSDAIRVYEEEYGDTDEQVKILLSTYEKVSD